jgi:hypothetical protein
MSQVRDGVDNLAICAAGPLCEQVKASRQQATGAQALEVKAE